MMIKTLLIFLALMITAATDTMPARSWPGFRGKGDSHTSDKRLPLEWADDKNVDWSTPLPGYGQSSPVIWQDRVFLTATDGENKEKLIIVCHNRKTGTNKVGVAFCLDLKTGEERWRERLGGEVWASPLAAGDRIYFFGVDGKTFVLRAGAKFEQLAVNTLTEVERVYGVAAMDGALFLRSGRKLVKLSSQ